MSRLGFFFLGPPEVLIDDQQVTFPTRKTIALLAYLSMTGKRIPRDTLAVFLWPELDQARAHASLRHALWTIRNAGLAEWLEVGESIGLKPGYELDIEVFHEKVAQSRTHGHETAGVCTTCDLLTEVVNLYRGDFMAGFTLRDSAEFDDWQLLQAESLRQELAEALEQLVKLYATAGEWEKALPHARRWVSLDTLHEPAHRWLMSIYALGGKRGLFLKQYETLRQTLHRELGIEPEPETRQLYEDILAGRVPASLPQPVPTPMQAEKAASLNNLPSPLTPLLGREADLAAVRAILSRTETRLLTLTGPPGIGKTRLSIQVATEMADDFKDGVRFVPLAPVREIDLVAITITLNLGVKENGDWTPVTALKDYFRNKNMLLVLDNFEQVVEAAPLVVELLQSCPGLKILATSRSPLKISGERQYPLSPLPLPDLNRPPSVETISKIPSIALFAARASLVDPEFALNEANAASVVHICHQLDGLPLAIELAAAWIKLLPPQTLLDRLSNRLSLLRGGPVDLPPRQRTLRAAIDWSYELLEDWEQTLLARFTVFAGGWTLEAAGEVVGWGEAGAENPSQEEILEGLFNLVEKSLVMREEYIDGQVRFNMLGTICEYATEKLTARREQEVLQQRHTAYYLELAQASEPGLRGSEQQRWLMLLRNEHNNLRAALQWALDQQSSETALKISGSLWRYWWMHGHLSEGRDGLEKALAIPSPGQTAWRAKALNGLGILARSQGDFAGARLFLEACLEIQRDLQDRSGVAAVLNSLGILLQYQGELDQAYAYHEESLRFRRETGGKREIAVSLNNLAMIAQEKGDFAQADELYRESLALVRQVNDARGIAAVLSNWGALMNDQGNAMEAETHFKESLSIFKDMGQRDDIIECLEGFAGAAALLHQPQRGARLLGAVDALREAIGSPIPPYKHARYRRFYERIAAYLGPITLDTEFTIGKKMSLDEAIAYALNENRD